MNCSECDFWKLCVSVCGLCVRTVCGEHRIRQTEQWKQLWSRKWFVVCVVYAFKAKVSMKALHNCYTKETAFVALTLLSVTQQKKTANNTLFWGLFLHNSLYFVPNIYNGLNECSGRTAHPTILHPILYSEWSSFPIQWVSLILEALNTTLSRIGNHC